MTGGHTVARAGRILCLLLWVPAALAGPEESGEDGSQLKDVYYGRLQLPPDETPDAHHTLDIYPAEGEGPRPVVLYVHGGGWAFGSKRDTYLLPDFFVGQGLNFISMNYRLRWDYTVYHQLDDIVTAIKWIVDNQQTYGLDASRIVLMGATSGGHLVSLIASNESFLQSVDLSFRNIGAAIAIETSAFDIKLQMEETGTFLERRLLSVIFGDRPEVWEAASPLTHIKPGKRVPPFVLLHRKGETSSSRQSKRFAKALVEADAMVIIIPSDDQTDIPLDRVLGLEGHAATLALITFIHAL